MVMLASQCNVTISDYLLHNSSLPLFSLHLQVVSFVCSVRGSHTQTLPLVNPMNQQCIIRPVVEGEQWRAAPSVTLEPHQHKTYEITYRPLTMTSDGKKHQVEEH